jgi:hypothetical protein
MALLVAAIVADHLRLLRSIISRSSSRAKPTPGPGTRECLIEPGQDAEATINATDAGNRLQHPHHGFSPSVAGWLGQALAGQFGVKRPRGVDGLG